MEARVTRLEDDIREVKLTLGRMEPVLARIDERIKHLPTTSFVVGTVVAIVGLVIAVIAVAPYLRPGAAALLGTTPSE